LYNILNEFDISMKLVRLIEMCLTGTYNKGRLGRNLTEIFPIRNALKKGDARMPLIFKFTLENAFRRVQVSQNGLKINGTYQLLHYADVNILGGTLYTIKENAEALIMASKETGLK